jgi:hypothetical protein
MPERNYIDTPSQTQFGFGTAYHNHYSLVETFKRGAQLSHPIIAHHVFRLLIQHLYIFLFAPLLSQPAWASAIFLYPETCTLKVFIGRRYIDNCHKQKQGCFLLYWSNRYLMSFLDSYLTRDHELTDICELVSTSYTLTQSPAQSTPSLSLTHCQCHILLLYGHHQSKQSV